MKLIVPQTDTDVIILGGEDDLSSSARGAPTTAATKSRKSAKCQKMERGSGAAGGSRKRTISNAFSDTSSNRGVLEFTLPVFSLDFFLIVNYVFGRFNLILIVTYEQDEL